MASLITYDAILNLDCELTTQWNMCGCNPAGTAPLIQLVWEEKAVGIGNVKREYIFIEPINESIKPFQLHGDTWWHEVVIKVDIRSWTTLARHNTVVKETSRIIKNIIRSSDDNFVDVVIMGSESKSPEYRNIFRHIITLKYRSGESHTFI